MHNYSKMTYYQIIRKILENSDRPLNVQEVWREVKKIESRVNLVRIYIVLGNMLKKGKVKKQKKGLYNYYEWVGFNKNPKEQ